MDTLKDLTADMKKLAMGDQWYRIRGVTTILAPQDPRFVRPYTYRKNGWGKIERVEAKTDGSPTQQTAPRRMKRTRSGEGETKIGTCWSFQQEDGPSSAVLLPWGGSYGLMKQGIRRSFDAQHKMSYFYPQLDEIKVYPTLLKVKGPIESLEAGPEVLLVPRNVIGRGSIRVEEFFDYVEDRDVEFLMEVDSESPINEEKFVAMLKALNTLDSFGPTKRGKFDVTKIEKVSLSESEKEKLHDS
jgi:hypothetical protein